MTCHKNALILGSSGRFGRHCAKAFEAAGWGVQKFVCGRDDLNIAAKDKDIIVNGWHVNYPLWAKERTLINHAVSKAALQNNATVIICANIYVYGPKHRGTLFTSTPHDAQNPLGRLQIESEQHFRDQGVKNILIRCGDFLDTQKTDSWGDRMIFKDLHRGILHYPGRIDAVHSWAFLPDVGRAAVALAEIRQTLNHFEEVHFAGFNVTARELANTFTKMESGMFKLKKMPWMPFFLLAPFWKMARHLIELRYLWDIDQTLCDRALSDLLPDFKKTELQNALKICFSDQMQRV